METMIKQSIKPQTSRVTIYLLALMILGFGAFAEHRSHESKSINIQTVHSQISQQ